MQAGFPTAPDPIIGTPNLFIFNDLLQYMRKCAQTHKSVISNKTNLLYTAIMPTLYTLYMAVKRKEMPNICSPSKLMRYQTTPDMSRRTTG
jgi:hypothetical protein